MIAGGGQVVGRGLNQPIGSHEPLEDGKIVGA